MRRRLADGKARQIHSWERLIVDRLKRPLRCRRPRQRTLHARQTLGPGQTQRDRQTHIRRRGLQRRCSVAPRHHRVHDGLRVNGRNNVLRRHVEEQVRLDQFQALVDQGRRVDRHDRTHLPRRMRESLLRPHATQLLARTTTERTTGCGENQVSDLGTARHNRRGKAALVDARRECLRNRRMLGIHRDDLPRATHRVLHEGATDNQRFLIRQRQACPAFQRCKGRRQAHAAGDSVQDDGNEAWIVLPRPLHRRANDIDRRLLAHEHLWALATQGAHSGVELLAHVACNAHKRGGKCNDLLGEDINRRATGAHTDDAKTPRMRINNVSSLGADRSRRSQKDDGNNTTATLHAPQHQSTARRISTARPR